MALYNSEDEEDRGSPFSIKADGGIMVDNAYSLVHGGVHVLNVGGAIQRASDPHAIFMQLQQEINKTDVLE